MKPKKILTFQPNIDEMLEQQERILHPLPDDFESASNEEKESFMEMKESTSYWKDAWRRLRRNRVAMVALIVLIITILFAFIGPMIASYGFEEQVRGSENLFPLEYSADELARKDAGESVFPHVFGTDKFGRDLMVRTMYGTRVSLVIGVVASLIVLVIGSIYGSIAGLFGGRVDFIMMRIVEAIYTVPDVLIVLLLKSVIDEPINNLINNSDSALIKSIGSLGSGIIAIFIVFGLLYWVGMSRIIRGQVLLLKPQEYITAARALGASNSRVIKRHLLPNCIGQIIVTTMMQIPSAIFMESFLSYLGMGVSAPMPSLGSLAADAMGGIYSYTYRLIIPSIILSVIILSFNLFGDGLRDALDPRMKK